MCGATLTRTRSTARSRLRNGSSFRPPIRCRSPRSPPTFTITEPRMKIMRRTDVDMRDRVYVKTLRATAEDLASTLDADSQVVLLGSVATGKYVDVLLPIFGDRLRFPAAFAGLGDMSRGGLMLRAVRANRELEYTTLDAPRHRAPGANGKMPAHLL